MAVEIDDYTQEEVVIKKEDWRVKDNIIQAMNMINKNRLAKSYTAKFMTYQEAVRMAKEIRAKNQCSILEASQILKEKLRKQYAKKGK